MRIYATATDHVNNHVYDVMVQPHFVGVPRLVEEGLFFAPFYEPYDHILKQKSKITIAKMVELFISNSSFDIIEDRDVLYILHTIDSYVEEVYHLRTDDTVGKYIEKILKLRARIYTLFRIVLNRHPQWKQAYQKQIGVFEILRTLYSPLGGLPDLPETLLEQLRICPTIREHEASEKAQKKETSPEPRKMIYDV